MKVWEKNESSRGHSWGKAARQEGEQMVWRTSRRQVWLGWKESRKRNREALWGLDHVKLWTFIPDAVRISGEVTVRRYRASRRPSHETRKEARCGMATHCSRNSGNRDTGEKWPDPRYVRRADPVALSLGWAWKVGREKKNQLYFL